MNINLENINLHSDSGPNSFGKKLIKYMSYLDVEFDTDRPDAYLCFIESHKNKFDAPLYQRLDGIYFNTDFDYNKQNEKIKKTYDIANGVIFQSYFNKQLISKYFGSHDNFVVIHNGADLETIEETNPMRFSHGKAPHISLINADNIWCCASSWEGRPHKRLNENIRFFFEHSDKDDVLMIAGEVPDDEKINFIHDRVVYLGELNQEQLYSLYKGSKYFIHLAWLDHCPNVVVDARACGCKIVCSSTGGTREIAGKDAMVIEEDEWNFEPVELYSPPPLDFSKKIENTLWNFDYNMQNVAIKYLDFIKGNLSASNS